MIKTKAGSFHIDIETLCQEKKMSYIDAVCHWCELNNLEIEYAVEIIKENAAFISKIQIEAENLNFIKKTARLPV
jgi:hypothetical protein